MESTLFTELTNSEATSLVGGGDRTARAFGTFSASARGEDFAETDGDVTTSASVDDDEAAADSSGFSFSEARDN